MAERLTVFVPSEVLDLLEHLARKRGDYDRRSTRDDGLVLGPAGAEATAQGAEILAVLKGPGADGTYGGLAADELANRLYGVALAINGFLAAAGKALPTSVFVTSGTALQAPSTATTPDEKAPGAISMSDDLEADAGDLGVGLLDD